MKNCEINVARERLKEFHEGRDGVPDIMRNRTQGELRDYSGKIVNMLDYEILKSYLYNTYYSVFILEEAPEKYFYGGKVITHELLDHEDAGLHVDVKKAGMKVKFTEKAHSDPNKNNYFVMDYLD
ncbi:hypothetical protein [Methanococcus maripaludis]|uniref:Uncharacterized protein n=2 Tax=Methanococcus maripaludis TaxID=39152 RepID=A0A7J9PJU7_METMI|nr:hypothetical protein [Methanococcus maripaludis]MBA2861799.1 hypothetical protein [Methanococcus maripaludis]